MEICPLCNRDNFYPSDHHLIPRCRGGKTTTTVHAIFSNKELESTYNSVDGLLGHEKFRKTVSFIGKQNPQTRIRTVLSNNQKRRGRNG